MSEELNVCPATDLTELEEKVSDIVTQVIQENDVDKTRDLISLFNWNMTKKSVVRVQKLNSLFDDVTEQMIKRFQLRPDQFSNDDLLNYMKTIQGVITTSNKGIEEVEVPAPKIVQNNTQININGVEQFDRESRARILAAVQATLAAAKNPENYEYEDKTDVSEDNSNES